MNVTHWDVIILGAGPAGLALARRLSSSHKVLILERQAAPSPGPRIGESLPGAASILLKKLGLLDKFLAGSHLERGVTVAIWDEEKSVWRDSLRDPCGPGWHLNRSEFDRMLREAALESGVTIRNGCRDIRIDRDQDGWSLQLGLDDDLKKAPILVDATGRSASIARRLGIEHLKYDPLLCIHTFLKSRNGEEDSATRILADENGWWYTVRIATGQRVLAYHLDVDNAQRQEWQQPESFLSRARRHPFLAEVLEQIEPEQLHVRPAGTAILNISQLDQAGSGFLAIGDAAITFDPISSQGLFNSLASAESAAKAILAECHKSPLALQNFQTEMIAVASRYMVNLRHTYQGPKRFSNKQFWAARQSHAATGDK